MFKHSVSKLQIIITVALGLATVASFIYQHSGGFLEPLNILRVLLVIAFLVFLFTNLQGIPSKGQLATETKRKHKYTETLVWLLPSLAVIFAIVNTIMPEVGHALVKGGEIFSFRPAIYIKMLLDIASCVIFILLAKRFMGRKQWLLVAMFILLALVTFWMAMEEISWGQRVFKWETTGYFAENNMQSETNLHNLNTQLFQNVLYFGGFLLLVAMPFFRDHLIQLLQKIKSLKPVIFLLPSAWMTIAFAAGMGFIDPYMSEAGWRWTSILFQTIATGAILAVYSLHAYHQRDSRSKAALWSLLAFIIVLTLSLCFRSLWDLDSGSPTEYIELFIAFGITSWAFELKYRSNDKHWLSITKS